jgi:hypothetical protein
MLKGDDNELMETIPTQQAMVLTEEQALELLALLITSARIQLDEPADKAPLRLLTAAQRLSAFARNSTSPSTQKFLEQIVADIEETNKLRARVEAYKSALDVLCGAIAGHLVVESGLGSELS